MTMEIVPADRFTLQELTDLYNQTRVDYLVPMPMNVDRLAEYVRDFDVDLQHSGVALDATGQVLGLCMLGIRGDLAWITRLGVLPSTRHTGTGSALMERMLTNADKLGLKETHLEVIQNNQPAYTLFLKSGFHETGNYLVIRRAPHPSTQPLTGYARWLDHSQALRTLATYPQHITWINAFESMRNSPNTAGLHLELPGQGSGWLVYRNTAFPLHSSLSHLIIHTEHGNPQEVGRGLLAHLHAQFPQHDTYAENILDHDPHLPAFQELGYFTNFTRVEMRRSGKTKPA